MRRPARGYLIHLRSRAALIRRNDDFGIGTLGKAYLFDPFARCEHFFRWFPSVGERRIMLPWDWLAQQ
jgi:hypothetical protein